MRIFPNASYLLDHGAGAAVTVVTVTDQFVITEAAVGGPQFVHRRETFEAEAVLVSTFPFPYLSGDWQPNGARVAPHPPGTQPRRGAGWVIDLRLVPESAYVWDTSRDDRPAR